MNSNIHHLLKVSRRWFRAYPPSPKCFPRGPGHVKLNQQKSWLLPPTKLCLSKKAKQDSLKKRPIKKEGKWAMGRRRQRNQTRSEDNVTLQGQVMKMKTGLVQSVANHTAEHVQAISGSSARFATYGPMRSVALGFHSSSVQNVTQVTEWCCRAKYFVPGIQRLYRYTLRKRLRMFWVRATLQSCKWLWNHPTWRTLSLI